MRTHLTSPIAERVAILAEASVAASRVFATIVINGPISRIDVARERGLSQAAVTKAVAPLLEAGLVADEAPQARPAGPGRPANPLSVVADALYTVGIKIDVHEVTGVVAGLSNRLVRSTRLPLHALEVEHVVATVRAVHEQLVAALGQAAERIVGVGVSVSGDVDSTTGIVRQSSFMGWQDVPLGPLVHDAIGLPVSVSNDVHALVTGEHWFGVGAGTASFAIVTIGRGIGAGVHVNGEVVEGAYGIAGEIGHLPVTTSTRICSCGRTGCVEAVAATSAVVDETSRVLGHRVTIQEAVSLARAGDDRVLPVFREAGAAVGTAIASLVNLVGPEVVLIGGEDVEHFDLLEQSLDQAFRARVFGAAARTRITARPHTFEDWARSAAADALQQLVRHDR